MNRTFENCTLLDTKTWFEKARPHKTHPNFIVQLGVHYEEVAESLEVLSGSDVNTIILIGDAHRAISALAEHLKNNGHNNPVHVGSPLLFLDSLCDQIVTATGVAHTLDYDVIGAMTEVNRSNFSKFDEAGKPIYDDNGKVIKGPNYSKADLSPYLPD